LEGWLEWPVELYAVERNLPSSYCYERVVGIGGNG
jgi:hypothetical protein